MHKPAFEEQNRYTDNSLKNRSEHDLAHHAFHLNLPFGDGQVHRGTRDGGQHRRGTGLLGAKVAMRQTICDGRGCARARFPRSH